MNVTKQALIIKLTKTKNDFNKHMLTDIPKLADKILTQYLKWVDKHGQKMASSIITSVTDRFVRKQVKEFSTIILTTDYYNIQYYVYKKCDGIYMYQELYADNKQEAIERAQFIDDIFIKGYTKATIECPTGEFIFTNWFPEGNEYAFPLPKDLEHTMRYSINNAAGRQRTMTKLAELHNLGYIQLGDTSCDVYKINEDKLILTPTWFIYYDEEDNEHEVTPPKEWEHLGSICCDVWKIEFIDKQFYDAHQTMDKEELKNKDVVTAKVSKGTWSFKNFYHFTGDKGDTIQLEQGKIPIWVELTKNKT